MLVRILSETVKTISFKKMEGSDMKRITAAITAAAADTAITGKRKRRADTGTSERRTVFKFPELQARGSIRYQNALQDILNGVSAFSSPEYRFRKKSQIPLVLMFF